jgi:RimJ/RimL family protein N-acetyltransferase
LTGAPELLTPRLRLRPCVAEDAAAIDREVADDRVARWTTHIPHPYPPGAAEAFIADTLADMATGHGFTFAILERASDELVGAIRLDRVEPAGTGEIGYWIAVPRWGRGYATEAARAVVRFGFEDLGLARLRTHVMPANDRSRRVLEKAGFIADGHGMVEAPARGAPVAVDVLLLERVAWRPDD